MSDAVRAVDELNDHAASTVVPARASDTEPAPPPELIVRLMDMCADLALDGEDANVVRCTPLQAFDLGGHGIVICTALGYVQVLQSEDDSDLRLEYCAEQQPELLKTLAAQRPCDCNCPDGTPGEHKNKCRSIGTRAWGKHEPDTSELADADAYLASGVKPIGPVAGIVRLPGEELLEALESEEDIVNANRELLEGRPLTSAETERWTRLFHEVMHESNKRLEKKGIVLLAAVPEPNGLGGVLSGCDRASIDAASRGIAMPSEDYIVTVTLPARERVDIARSEREEFARRLIDLVCSECIEQQAAYRAKARMH